MSVASLRRYVRTEFAEEGAEERATVLRDDPPPGAEAVRDWRAAAAGRSLRSQVMSAVRPRACATG